MGFRTCMLAALSIALFCGNGMAALYDCTDDSHAGCVAKEPGSALCTSNACVCAPNLYTAGTDDCVGKTCTLGTSAPATACSDGNAACSSENKCLCQANFIITRDASDNSQSCTQKECASVSATTDCTGDNSYCDTGPTQPLCKCKINFAAVNLEKCTRVECDDSSPCSASNIYCKTGTDAGCNCIGTYSADATTGACTIISCAESATSASITTTCGANTVCEARASTYQCFCKAGYTSTGSATCVQTPCTTGTLANDCGDGAAYQCDTDGKCACATNYKESGSRCKKECTANSNCDDNATCMNGICECNVNYQGNGDTCAQLTCSGTTTTGCHPNSQCSSDKCECASGYVADGTTCKKSCTADNGCHSNGICVSDKCECKATFVGDGANTCTSVACTANADCTLDNSSCNTTSNACECSSGYEFGATTIACVETTTNATTTAGAVAVAFNFSFMAASFLMAIFINKM